MSSISQEDNIYVTLFSNSSTNIYKNTPNTFTNLLNQSLNLNEQWVVGLSDISFSLMDNHEKSSQNIIKRRKRNVSTLQTPSSVDSKLKISKSSINVEHEEIKNKFKSILDSTMKSEVKITNLEKNSSKPENNISTTILNEIAEIKQTNTPLDNDKSQNKSINKTINIKPKNNEENPILSASKIFLENSIKKLPDNFNKIKVPEVNNIIFVYTDIIKPRYVGNKKTKCLKIMSISTLKNYIHFNRVEYFPIETLNINDISIMIRNDEGLELNLIDYIPVYCTLHFKKKNIYI